jgi:hypothetical protein
MTLLLYAQPRELAQYPAHANLTTGVLAAEFLVHSIPVERGTFVAQNYLVIDAAIFGDGSRPLSASHFTLRINGKKDLTFPQSPAWVAATIKDPAWAGQKPQLTMGGGLGNAGVVLGGPPRVERFPGDPTSRRPQPPGTPTSVEATPTMTMEEQIERVSFPEGPRKLPAGGLLYFAYKGKLKSIKAMELLYDGPAGRAVLKLEP